ncbi:hypothetical protein VPH159E362A_0058 [Vibrio phage 159E36-2a]
MLYLNYLKGCTVCFTVNICRLVRETLALLVC